jgi:Arc/MetJ family transcription regulator
MTQIAVDDKLMQEALDYTPLSDAESVVEKALQYYVSRMKTKAELLQRYTDMAQDDWANLQTQQSDEQSHEWLRDTWKIDNFKPLTREEIYGSR